MQLMYYIAAIQHSTNEGISKSGLVISAGMRGREGPSLLEPAERVTHALLWHPHDSEESRKSLIYEQNRWFMVCIFNQRRL